MPTNCNSILENVNSGKSVKLGNIITSHYDRRDEDRKLMCRYCDGRITRMLQVRQRTISNAFHG